MQNDVKFAGFGGQGILLIGKILAHAAMIQEYEVAWVPSYGPEMRGGTAYCTVIISDDQIGSPVVVNPKNLIAMNKPSLEKFAPTVKKNGIILINSSLINIDSGRDDVDELKIPVVDIANDLGNPKVANIIALSAFVARSNIVDLKIIRECVKDELQKKPKLIDINMKAIDAGIKSIEK